MLAEGLVVVVPIQLSVTRGSILGCCCFLLVMVLLLLFLLLLLLLLLFGVAGIATVHNEFLGYFRVESGLTQQYVWGRLLATWIHR